MDDQVPIPIPVLEPITESYQPFQYQCSTNYNTFSNILLVSYSVYNYHQFVSSVNTNTFPIVYYKNTDLNAIQTFLLTHFTNIQRICFVTHGLPLVETTSLSPISEETMHSLPLMSRESFFTFSDLELPSSYSIGITFLKTIVETLNISHIDFLGCNLLLYPEWKSYFEILTTFTNHPIIGASDNNVGNLKYGGDWVLESTMEDIQFIYFTSSIETYTSLLNTYTYNYNDNGIFRTITYTSNGDIVNISTLTGGVTIPATVNGNVITIVSMSSSSGSTNSLMTSLTISNGITTIGYNPSYDEYAFYGSTQLTQLTLPRSLLYLGGGSFSGAQNLRSVQLPSQLLRIGDINTNQGCFSDCWKLSSITIPTTVTYIGSSSFANTLKKTTMLNSVVFEGKSIDTIDSYAFFCTNISSIALPYNLQNIGSFCFNGTYLTSVTLPSSVKNIRDSCFPLGLQTINIPPNSQLQTIGASNPFGISITSISIPSTVVSIGTNCFQGCTNLLTLLIPPSVTFLGSQVFYNMNNLQSIRLASQANSISDGSYLFANCPNLTSLSFSTCIFSGIHLMNKNTFVTSSSINSITVTDPSTNNIFLYTGSYRNIYATATINTITNFTYLSLLYKIPTLSYQSNQNVYMIHQFDTVLETNGIQYTNQVLINCFLQNYKQFQGNLFLISSSCIIPGYTQIPLSNITIYNSIQGITTNYTNSIMPMRNHSFYVLMDVSGDFTTIYTLGKTAVNISKLPNTYYLVNYRGINRHQPPADSFQEEGLSFTGGIYGQSTDALTNVNTYYHCFYSVNKTRPSVLTRTLYDNYNNLIQTTDMSYGGLNVIPLFTSFDNNTYTIGKGSMTNGTMDLACCNFYSKALSTNQQTVLVNYINRSFLEPHSGATIYIVTLSGDHFWMTQNTQISQQTDSIVLESGLYVFDQSDPSNKKNTLLLTDLSQNIVTKGVTYNGIAGNLNASTTIDLSGVPPTTYLFSKTSTIMGNPSPSTKYMVLWLDAIVPNLTDNVTINTFNVKDKSPLKNTLVATNGITYSVNGLKSGYPGFLFVPGTSSGFNFNMSINTFLTSLAPHMGGMTFFSVVNLRDTGSSSGSLISTAQSFFDFFGSSRIFYNLHGYVNQNIDYNKMNDPSIYFFTFSVTSTTTTLSETLYTSNYQGISYLKNPLTNNKILPIPNENFDTLGKLSIGGKYQPGSSVADPTSIGGALSEVLVYNSVLNNTTINQILEYLRNKWSI